MKPKLPMDEKRTADAVARRTSHSGFHPQLPLTSFSGILMQRLLTEIPTWRLAETSQKHLRRNNLAVGHHPNGWSNSYAAACAAGSKATSLRTHLVLDNSIILSSRGGIFYPPTFFVSNQGSHSREQPILGTSRPELLANATKC